jgi:hypothetical protein
MEPSYVFFASFFGGHVQIIQGTFVESRSHRNKPASFEYENQALL